MHEAFIEKINLEEWETGGYMMYRIPGIIVTQKGTVLAHYEARMGEGDWIKQDVLLKRSENDGKTWGERIILAKGCENEILHNAIIISDKNGDAHFIWNKNYNQCFYQKSTDDGLTWSEPKGITEVFERFRREYNWNIIAVGPGHGIQLSNGRLFVPVWLSNGGKIHRPSVLSCIFSDDGGDSWDRGEIIWDKDGFINPNETEAVQLEDGSVLMNIRHESDICNRAYSISKDGATGWSKPEVDMALPDPICFASIIRYKEKQKDGTTGILFSNCVVDGVPLLTLQKFDNDEVFRGTGRQSRKHLTVRLSDDECVSWKYSREIEEYAGYSDLAVSKDKKTILCLYERNWINNNWGNTKNMAIARFNIDWVKAD